MLYSVRDEVIVLKHTIGKMPSCAQCRRHFKVGEKIISITNLENGQGISLQYHKRCEPPAVKKFFKKGTTDHASAH